jgi:hypothetical protein
MVNNNWPTKSIKDFTLEDAILVYNEGFYCVCTDSRITSISEEPIRKDNAINYNRIIKPLFEGGTLIRAFRGTNRDFMIYLESQRVRKEIANASK